MNFWRRDTISCIPQNWSCSMCEWEGDDPRTFLSFDHGIILRDPAAPWPTCPSCGEHRFYVEDCKWEG